MGESRGGVPPDDLTGIGHLENRRDPGQEGVAIRQPVSTAQWKRGLDRRGLLCQDHGPGYGI